MTTPTPRYGSIEWLERMREAVREASHADTGAIRNSLMKLSQAMNTFYGEEWVKHHAARAQPPAPDVVVEALRGLVAYVEREVYAGRFPRFPRDHACLECLAGYPAEIREIVKPGFQCAWHSAHAALSTLTGHTDKDQS